MEVLFINMAILQTFLALRNYLKGKISQYELMDSDKLIDRVKENRTSNGLSNIIIEFDSFDEMGEIIGLNEDDIYFYNIISNPHSSYELYDSYYASDDFEQGYGPWSYFDSENIELIEKIAKYYLNQGFDSDDDSSKAEFAKKMDKFFSREMSELLDEFSYYKNAEFMETARTNVIPEFEDYIQQSGFNLYGSDMLSINASDLYSLFVQYDAIHLTLKELLKKIFKDSDRQIGGWDENRYEYQDDRNFDDEGFNRDVNRILEKILEKTEEDIDGFAEYKEMIDRITKKYRLGTWYDLPKDNQYMFRISGFDRDNRKIQIEIKKKGKSNIGKFNVSEDGFYKLLYQPELFKLEI